jgi:hypothetical protein
MMQRVLQNMILVPIAVFYGVMLVLVIAPVHLICALKHRHRRSRLDHPSSWRW